MLKTIRHFDRKTREGILSEIALELGRPSIGDNYSLEYRLMESENNGLKALPVFEVLKGTWNRPNDARLMVLGEIFQHLKLSPSLSYSFDIQTKLLNFVGKEIRSLALDSGRIMTVRKRLGQRGVLAPNAYKISFAKEFDQLSERFGVTKKEVRDGIHHPDMVKHFIAEVQNRNDAISLYVKSYSNGTDPYSLLIDAMRAGDAISVHIAVKVYHSDVDVSTVGSPTELLKAFTDKFGEEISFNGERGRLFLYKKMQTGVNHLVPSQTKNAILRASSRILSDGTQEYSIAYGINSDEYTKSLRSHGVKEK